MGRRTLPLGMELFKCPTRGGMLAVHSACEPGRSVPQGARASWSLLLMGGARMDAPACLTPIGHSYLAVRQSATTLLCEPSRLVLAPAASIRGEHQEQLLFSVHV